MTKIRKKPVEIKAVRFSDASAETLSRISEFVSDIIIFNPIRNTVAIPSLKGIITANVGDYIARNVNDECYICKSDFFKQVQESTTLQSSGIISTIKNLNLAHVSIDDIDIWSENEFVVTVSGGFNSCNNDGHWLEYLEQIKKIIGRFKGAYLINLDNDVLDDVWTLKIAVPNK